MKLAVFYLPTHKQFTYSTTYPEALEHLEAQGRVSMCDNKFGQVRVVKKDFVCMLPLSCKEHINSILEHFNATYHPYGKLDSFNLSNHPELLI